MRVDLSSLNNKQLEAVKETEGSVLVLAGAGTGKTKVLTTRLAYIVDQGLADISEILAVTFTNKASNEMKQRALSLLRIPSQGYMGHLWIGTFHSLALKMIRPLNDHFGLSSNFSIIDADDQSRIVKKIIKDLGLDDKKYTHKAMSYYINRWKDQLKSPDDASRMAKRYTSEEQAARIYHIYQNTLRSLDAIDFGDIVMICVSILKSDESVLKYYQNKFKYIMVDEYQDTNIAQYVWLKLLSMQRKNICCVGDDDQSIYSFRGADIDNILKFEDDYQGAKIIRLEQNYRSTGNILKAANHLIANNDGRLKKELWTEKEAGLPVLVKGLHNPFDEAAFVANLIAHKNSTGISFSDIAILVRAAFQTRLFEDRFLALNIPYKVVGGMRFYERKEVKDAVAYLKLIANPDDCVALERIINVPKRGIGPTTISKFYEIAKENEISIVKAANNFAMSGSAGINSKLRSFFEDVDRWRIDSENIEPSVLMQKVLKESGYISMLKEKKTLEDEARLETLNELVVALEEFETLKEFLEYISLVLDNSESSSNDPKVTVSTIHGAKGLEYDSIFIPGFEEGIFPHQKSLEEKGMTGLEEERRLFYVAITRARKEAYITFCNRRNMSYKNDYWQTTYPSRFLQNLPLGPVKIL